MINLYDKTFTIYNVIPKSGTTNPSYGYRKVINLCNQQGGFRQNKSGNSLVIQNGNTFYTKDLKVYLPPTWEPGGYYALPIDKRADYYTLAPGDFIVFDEIIDEIDHSSSSTWNALKGKYAATGMTVKEVMPFINKTKTDHLEAVSV